MLSIRSMFKKIPLMFTSKAHWSVTLCTHFLRLLDGDFAGSPGDDVEVYKGVENKKKVHGRDREQINEARYDAEEFLRMKTRSYEEGPREGNQEDG